MSFHEVQFSPRISLGSTGGPGFSTTIIATDGGQEYRSAIWSGAGRRKYNAKWGIKSKDDAYYAYNFFIARSGAANGFRWKDWTDYCTGANGRDLSFGGTNPTAIDQQFGTGDGSTATFQLRKAYSSGPATIYRNIAKPVAGSVLVAKNSTPLSTGWSIDVTTGLVTFASPPANGDALTWGGLFDTPVRFDASTDFERGGLQVNLEDFDIRNIDLPISEIQDPGQVYEEAFSGGAQEICNTAPTTISQSGGRLVVVNTSFNGVIILPPTAVVPPGGPIFVIVNLGPNTLTVKRNDGSTLVSFGTGEGVEVFLSIDGGGNRIWYAK
jgi:uncharacterized protein (TIGR02217 family)